MDIFLQKSEIQNNKTIIISGSKSETNRLLLLQALYPQLSLENCSDSDDSNVMSLALKTENEVIDIHHAGTAMRFLTAYFASKENKTITLTGSSRMKERPIKILVNALKQLGAKISYLENEGFPPLKIEGIPILKDEVLIESNVSSQYISALLLIGSSLKNGIKVTLAGEMTSVPYIKMTLSLLKQIGILSNFENNIIRIFPKTHVEKQTLIIESDWSSASYFYSIIALSKVGTEITLGKYQENSLQGDSELETIYKLFGVETVFANNEIRITKTNVENTNVVLNLNKTPDLAQTIAVTAFGLKMSCHLRGLHTLKIKETDRLQALQMELSKLGAQISVTDETLTLEPSSNFIENVKIATYNDHRMAMAFAPLALKFPITIENAEVVSKSYRNFWSDLDSIGFKSVKTD